MSTSILPKISTYHHTNAIDIKMDTSKNKIKKQTANVKSGKRQSKPREYKGTKDMQAAEPSSSQGYNFSEFHQQKRKEYPFFDQYRSTGKRSKSEMTEGHPKDGTEGTTGGITFSNEPRAESDSRPSVILIKTEKTDNGNVISTPQDAEMSPEVSETAEGIKKMTIEEIQQMRLRQQVSSNHTACEGDSDSISLSKGIIEGGNQLRTEDETSSLAKPIPAEPSLVVPQYRQSMTVVSDRTQVSRLPRNFTQGSNQMRTGDDTSSLAKPIPAESSLVVPQYQQSTTMVSGKPKASRLPQDFIQGSDQMRTGDDTSSLAKPIPAESSLVVPQYQQSTTMVSDRTRVTRESQGFTKGSSQIRTEDTSSFVNPIPENLSFGVSPQRQQNVPLLTSRIPVSTVSMATAPGDSHLMTDSATSSLALPIPAVQSFTATQCQHCMHRPTMVSTETQTESPRLVSTVTQTEEVSIRQDVQPANNPMMQQGQLVPMASQHMQVQPVQDQNVALVQRSNSMEVERHEDSEASAPVEFSTAGNSALFVSRTWTNDFGRSTLFNRFLASLVAMLGLTVCTPVLQRSKKPMVKDSESGVIQIYPDEGKLSKLTQHQPGVDWFFQHRSLYPHLSQLPNVKSVIGYLSIGEDKGLIDAAKDFKQSLYPRAKLIFFNLAIPEDFGDTEGEADALDKATEADVVFSVGHHTYYHFENKYKALFEAEPKHYLYLPPLTDMFINTKVVPTEGKQQVLSVCNVSSEADFDKYSLGAIAMGKLVNAYYHAYERLPVWSIIGVEKNMLSKFEKFLQDKADSRQLRISVYSSNSLKDFRRSLLQSVLFIAPEKVDSFNFTAYLAMQAGIPVLVPNCSGLVTFLDSLFRYKDYSGFCGVETGLHDFSLDRDGDRWKDAMISRLNANRRNISFKKANELKNDLKSCEELKISHERFLRELV